MKYKGTEAETILGKILESQQDLWLPQYNEPDVCYPLHIGATGYYQDSKTNRWVAFDNTTGDCWIEEFDTSRKASMWCDGKEVKSLT